MKDTKSKEIKVGILSIFAIAVLIIGITLGKGVNLSGAENLVKFRFPDSGGLKSGEPIVVNGVERGKVIEVSNDKGSVLVTGQIPNSDDIKQDATAKITILEITGGKKIEINPGKSEKPFDFKNEIPGKTPPDISGLVAVVGDLANDGADIIKRIDSIVIEVNSLLSDEQFMSDIKTTVSNAKILSDDLVEFSDNNLNKISAAVNDLKELSAELKYALIENDNINVNTILTKIDKTLDNTEKLTANANNSLKNVDELINDLSDLSNDIKKGDGTISKLIYDKNLAVQIDSAIVNLEKFIGLIKEHGVNVNVRLGSRP